MWASGGRWKVTGAGAVQVCSADRRGLGLFRLFVMNQNVVLLLFLDQVDLQIDADLEVQI